MNTSSNSSAQETSSPPLGSVSRRNFLKALGSTAVAAAATQAKGVAEDLRKYNAEKLLGPEPTPITLEINGEVKQFQVEPRVTLLEVLRGQTTLTGTKEVCDRATCGACTVLFDGMPVYSCMKLAIEAQGRKITTVEGLAKPGQMTAVQKAFVECDGLQCGFCTPGFVLCVTALLERNPKPTEGEVRKAVSGNLCRCGSYPRIVAAALEASGVKQPPRAEILSDVRLA